MEVRGGFANRFPSHHDGFMQSAKAVIIGRVEARINVPFVP